MRRVLLLLFCAPMLMGSASRNFDGTNDEIDMGNVLNVTTGNVSIAAWWKGTEDADADMILVKSADNGTGDGYRLRQNSGDTAGCSIGDGSVQLASSGPDTDGAWFWIVCTFDGAGDTTVLYTNGAQSDTDTGTVGSISTTANLQFGEDSADGNDANGRIAYGMVYGTSLLNLVEVNELMWHPEAFPTNSAGGVKGGLWTLWGDDPEPDLTGNGRTGSVVAGAAASTDGPPVMIGGYLPL